MKQYLEILQKSLTPIRTFVKPYYNQAQDKFLQWTSDINFTLFCLIYAIVLIYLISKFTRQRAWRPKNKQLKTTREWIKNKLYSTLFSIPILKTYVNNTFQQKLDKQEVSIVEGLHKHWDHRQVSSLPADGMSDDNMRKRIYQWAEKEKLIWNTGKISGAFYVNSEQHMQQMNDFAATYLYHNPLHLDTYKELLKIQKQILDMTSSLLTSQQNKFYYGVITSGGSQSLISAIYAYRNFYNKSKPNIVIPVTAHAALDKGCFYLNVQARKVKLNAKYEADLEHMESLIDSNTIMVVASIPNYPHGIIDDVKSIAKLAKKYNIGCHLDGCLGGFVGLFHKNFKDLFSLDRDGVTSVSLDHHKFGLAPKGISTIFYKTPELRQSQYFVNMDWRGGIYGTMGFPGSRSGFASAAAWYSLTQITMKGFKNNADIITTATQKGAQSLRKLKGIQVFGEPQMCVIAFGTTEPQCSHLALTDFLCNQRKWNISAIHKPKGIHISVTLANCDNVTQKLAKDVDDGLNVLRSRKQVKQSLASAIYGSSAKIPTNNMEHDMLKLLLAASLK